MPSKAKVMNYYNIESKVFEETRYGSEGGKAYFEINAKIASDVLGSVDRKLILDIGTGTGRYAEYLIERGSSVIGIDLSIDMLKLAKQKRIWCIKADAENLPFRSNVFDAAICIKTVRFLTDAKRAFTEINKVFKNNSIFVFNFFNDSAVKSRIARKLGLILGRKLKYDISYKDMVNIILSCNFTIVETRGTMWLLTPFWKTKNRYLALFTKSLEKLVDNFLPSTWASLLFIGCKKQI